MLAASARVPPADAAATPLVAKWAFQFASAKDGEAAAAALTSLRRRVVGVESAAALLVQQHTPPPAPLVRGPDLLAAVQAVLASPSFDACVEAVVADVVGMLP